MIKLSLCLSLGFEIHFQMGTDRVLVCQREAEFYEPSALHGSNGCGFPSSCNTYNGRECGWHHVGSCQRWFQDHLVSAV